jgi:hypothetical protein
VAFLEPGLRLPLATQPKACVYDRGRSAAYARARPAGSPVALQPILQRSIRDLGFASNRRKRPAVLEVSAQNLEALKRALARGLGKRSQLRHPEFLILTRTRKISTKKSRKIIPKFTCLLFGDFLFGVNQEAAGIHVLLTRSLFACDILRRFLPRVSLAKSNSAPLQFLWHCGTKSQFGPRPNQ